MVRWIKKKKYARPILSDWDLSRFQTDLSIEPVRTKIELNSARPICLFQDIGTNVQRKPFLTSTSNETELGDGIQEVINYPV